MPKRIYATSPRMYAVRQIAAGRVVRERYYHSYWVACRYQDRLRLNGKCALMRIMS